MKRVALVLFPGFQMLDAAGPLDVFAEANALLGSDADYALTTVGPTRDAVVASNGMSTIPALSFSDPADGFDLLLVAGGPALPTTPPEPALLAWLQAAARSAACVGSICTGAFVLAHARLLDGRSAATHWRHVDDLARQFPAIAVERDRIFVQDGPVLTSAGVTAGIDLALAIVAQDHGPALATAVAKQLLVHVQRQGGQSQFSPFLQAGGAPDSLLAKVQRFVLERLAEPLTVVDLAAFSGMSPRNFTRQFHREAQTSPADFLQRARVDAARQMLEATALPLKVVAHRSGFGNAPRMRQVFMRLLDVTPSDYRGRFRRNG